MREYIAFEASHRQAYGQFSGVVRLFRNWLLRRDLKRLMALDDYLLRDIGLSRDDLRLLLRQPLNSDWQWEAERRQLLGHSPAVRPDMQDKPR